MEDNELPLSRRELNTYDYSISKSDLYSTPEDFTQLTNDELLDIVIEKLEKGWRYHVCNLPKDSITEKQKEYLHNVELYVYDINEPEIRVLELTKVKFIIGINSFLTYSINSFTAINEDNEKHTVTEIPYQKNPALTNMPQSSMLKIYKNLQDAEKDFKKDAAKKSKELMDTNERLINQMAKNNDHYDKLSKYF